MLEKKERVENRDGATSVTPGWIRWGRSSISKKKLFSGEGQTRREIALVWEAVWEAMNIGEYCVYDAQLPSMLAKRTIHPDYSASGMGCMSNILSRASR